MGAASSKPASFEEGSLEGIIAALRKVPVDDLNAALYAEMISDAVQTPEGRNKAGRLGVVSILVNVLCGSTEQIVKKKVATALCDVLYQHKKNKDTIRFSIRMGKVIALLSDPSDETKLLAMQVMQAAAFEHAANKIAILFTNAGMTPLISLLEDSFDGVKLAALKTLSVCLFKSSNADLFRIRLGFVPLTNLLNSPLPELRESATRLLIVVLLGSKMNRLLFSISCELKEHAKHALSILAASSFNSGNLPFWSTYGKEKILNKYLALHLSFLKNNIEEDSALKTQFAELYPISKSSHPMHEAILSHDTQKIQSLVELGWCAHIDTFFAFQLLSGSACCFRKNSHEWSGISPFYYAIDALSHGNKFPGYNGHTQFYKALYQEIMSILSSQKSTGITLGSELYRKLYIGNTNIEVDIRALHALLELGVNSITYKAQTGRQLRKDIRSLTFYNGERGGPVHYHEEPVLESVLDDNNRIAAHTR